MPIQVFGAHRFVNVGETWAVWVLHTDDDGTNVAADSVTGTTYRPDEAGQAMTVEAQTTVGLYKVYRTQLNFAGHHEVRIVTVHSEHGQEVWTTTFIAHESAATLTAEAPGVSEVMAYLGNDNSYTSAEVGDALEAEARAQARRCNLPSDYPPDLAEALKRRVARNLAARSVPVATFTSFEGGGTSSRVPSVDAEVRRLEEPYLALPSA